MKNFFRVAAFTESFLFLLLNLVFGRHKLGLMGRFIGVLLLGSILGFFSLISVFIFALYQSSFIHSH